MDGVGVDVRLNLPGGEACTPPSTAQPVWGVCLALVEVVTSFPIINSISVLTMIFHLPNIGIHH